MGEKVALTITMAADGSVNVNGPLHNKILCFGLLKVAEHLVYEYQAEKNQLVVPRFATVPFDRQ